MSTTGNQRQRSALHSSELVERAEKKKVRNAEREGRSGPDLNERVKRKTGGEGGERQVKSGEWD